MPNIYSNRRIIGRNILQHYSINTNYRYKIGVLENISYYEVGFKPKMLILLDESNIEIFTKEGYNVINDKGENVSDLMEFNNTGFTLNFEQFGKFVVIGGN